MHKTTSNYSKVYIVSYERLAAVYQVGEPYWFTHEMFVFMPWNMWRSKLFVIDFKYFSYNHIYLSHSLWRELISRIRSLYFAFLVYDCQPSGSLVESIVYCILFYINLAWKFNLEPRNNNCCVVLLLCLDFLFFFFIINHDFL